MVVETWLLSIAISIFELQMSSHNFRLLTVFRIARLVRVFRLAKLFRFMPELLVIIRGIGIAMRAIWLVFALLGISSTLLLSSSAFCLRTRPWAESSSRQ